MKEAIDGSNVEASVNLSFSSNSGYNQEYQLFNKQGTSADNSLKESSPSVQLKSSFLDIEAQDSTASGSLASTLSLKKKKVNIAGEHGKRDEDSDPEQVQETTALNQGECVTTATTEENYFTLSGTIKRGKKAGQSVDVKVNISREELERLESTRSKIAAVTHPDARRRQQGNACDCGLLKGLHILLWSLICFPFVFIISAVYSFYIGTITWYNVFSLYTDFEEKALLCRILMAPILIILYPFFIVLTTLGLGLYAALEQLTWSWYLWLSRVVDFEKGFYAWMCTFLHIEECSPYTEIVIIDQLNQ